jgi:hypothetical protein
VPGQQLARPITDTAQRKYNNNNNTIIIIVMGKVKTPFIYNNNNNNNSLVVKALGYKPEGHRFETRWGEILNLPNVPAALGPGVYSASNRNE